MSNATHKSRDLPIRRIEVVSETDTHVDFRMADIQGLPRATLEERFEPIAPPPFLRRADVVEAHAAMVALAENCRAKEPDYAEGVQACADHLRDLLEGKTP